MRIMLDERPSLRAVSQTFRMATRVPGILRGIVARHSTRTTPFAGQATSINQPGDEFIEGLTVYFGTRPSLAIEDRYSVAPAIPKLGLGLITFVMNDERKDLNISQRYEY
jgi:hypothetical protein